MPYRDLILFQLKVVYKRVEIEIFFILFLDGLLCSWSCQVYVMIVEIFECLGIYCATMIWTNFLVYLFCLLEKYDLISVVLILFL